MMKRLKAVMFWLAMASMINADVWVIAPDGYYLLKLDDSGAPITTPAVGITGHQFMGQPDSPDIPDPPGPTEDKWGLVALSQTEAMKVNDPNRDETAGKVGIAYQEIGKLVQDGTVPKDKLKAVLQLAFNAATGNSKTFWVGWKAKTDAGYNAVDFSSAADAGQGLIDIGLGASRTSNTAIGDWLKFFIEVILPLILSLIDLLDSDSAVTLIQSMEVTA